MSLLLLPKEIRLQIFSELLVRTDPFIFASHDLNPNPRNHPMQTYRQKGNDLHPNLLQINQQIHDEASTLLYAENTFWFPGLHFSVFDPRTGVPDRWEGSISFIRPFLARIGTRAAALIRHICITLPHFEGEYRVSTVKLREEDDSILLLFREKCTSLATLDLFLSYDNELHQLCNVPEEERDGIEVLQARALEQIDARLRSISSLKNVRVIFHALYDGTDDEPKDSERFCIYGLGFVEKIFNQETASGEDEMFRIITWGLHEKMCNHGWTSVIRWTRNGRKVFDNRADCRKFNTQEEARNRSAHLPRS